MDSHRVATPDFAVFGIIFAVYAVVLLGALGFSAFLHWKIAKKAGYSGVFGIVAAIPVANLIMFIIFAFAEWPIERALRAAGGGPTSGPLPFAGTNAYVPPGGGGYAPPANEVAPFAQPPSEIPPEI